MRLSGVSLDLVWGGATALIAVGLGLSLFLIAKPGGPGGPQWNRYLKSIDAWLDLLAYPVKPIEVVGYQLFFMALMVGGWLMFDLVYLLYVIPVVIPATYVILRIAYDQRIDAIALQLDGWLLMLSNMLKATGSVGNAIEASSGLVRSPLKEEVELLVKQFEVGMTLENALANMYIRVPSVALRTVVTSLRIGRRLGGDLPSLLAENAATIREAERIERFIRAQVAQGKAQMIVLALSPLSPSSTCSCGSVRDFSTPFSIARLPAM